MLKAWFVERRGEEGKKEEGIGNPVNRSAVVCDSPKESAFGFCCSLSFRC